MNDWWSDIDNEILTTLGEGGAMEAAEVGRRLGLTESAVTSLISSLASQGKVRIRLVELRAERPAEVAALTEAR